MGTITRRALAVVLLSAAVVTTGAVPAQSASAQSASAQPAPLIGVLTGVRTGVHPTFDRIVLDFTGPPPQINSYRFVDELIQDGSGHIEWLTGVVFLEVIAFPAYTHDEQGNSSWPGPPKFRTRNLTNVMAVSVPGSYEAVLTIGVGMRKKTWARVFTLTSPSRIVIDVGR